MAGVLLVVNVHVEVLCVMSALGVPPIRLLPPLWKDPFLPPCRDLLDPLVMSRCLREFLAGVRNSSFLPPARNSLRQLALSSGARPHPTRLALRCAFSTPLAIENTVGASNRWVFWHYDGDTLLESIDSSY